MDADTLLFATGRQPNSHHLNLAAVGVDSDSNGSIVVDAYGQTSVPSIYAVGDVCNRINLTPMALAEAMAFLATRFGDKPTTIEDMVVPTAVFSNPEIATLGLTEHQARAQYDKGRTYRSTFRPMKLTLTDHSQHMLMKMNP